VKLQAEFVQPDFERSPEPVRISFRLKSDDSVISVADDDYWLSS
jgi:hypothetical protein